MSRLILPGQPQPVVAGAIEPGRPKPSALAGPRIVQPGELVRIMQANGAPTNVTFGRKPGRVLLAISVGPVGIPLDMDVTQARELHQRFGEAIAAADLSPPAAVDDVLPFPPVAEAVADSPVDDDDKPGLRLAHVID